MAALSFVVVVMSCELNKGKTADNFQLLGIDHNFPIEFWPLLLIAQIIKNKP